MHIHFVPKSVDKNMIFNITVCLLSHNHTFNNYKYNDCNHRSLLLFLSSEIDTYELYNITSTVKVQYDISN